jgi:hypothetical protein
MIDSYELTINNENLSQHTLIYHGNQNIILRYRESLNSELEIQILIDRHILEKFLEMIK